MGYIIDAHHKSEELWLELGVLLLPDNTFNPMHFSKGLIMLLDGLRISDVEDPDNGIVFIAGLQSSNKRAITLFDTQTKQTYVIATNGQTKQPASKIMIFDDSDSEQLAHSFLAQGFELQTSVYPLVVERNEKQVSWEDVKPQLSEVWSRISNAFIPNIS